MKEKERLLSFEESVCFIFSHSALKEGWDNPNIFQICTLNETRSATKKRQEIGRGMRLAVDVRGDRVFDQDVNILTVIANESYRTFAGALQEEYTDAGYAAVPEAADKRRKVTVKFQKHLAVDNEDFKRLWEKIRRRTAFNIALDTEELLTTAIGRVNELTVQNLVVRV